MTTAPVANAATNLALLRYLCPTPPLSSCPDCAGPEPEDMCAAHQEDWWLGVLADRAEDEREMSR